MGRTDARQVKKEKLGAKMEVYFVLDTGVQFGIPVLECNGQVLQGNGTIAKFLAAKYSELRSMQCLRL